MVFPLEFYDLGLFRHIAEAGSITAGAARAHLALAAASKRIRNMEEILGLALFDRSKYGVTLTPAGVILLDHARRLLVDAERMREEMASLGGSSGGHIKILSNTNALVEFLPDILGQFLTAYPGTTLDLKERLSDEIIDLVADGTADLGIVASTTNTETLEVFPFRSSHLVLVVPKNHEIANRSEITFAEVNDRDFVGLESNSAIQRFLAYRAAREGRKLRSRVQLRSFDIVCKMVEVGVGIAIVPKTSALHAAHTMAIAIIPLKDEWALRDLRICTRSREKLSQSAQRLLEKLTEKHADQE